MLSLPLQDGVTDDTTGHSMQDAPAPHRRKAISSAQIARMDDFLTIVTTAVATDPGNIDLLGYLEL